MTCRGDGGSGLLNLLLKKVNSDEKEYDKVDVDFLEREGPAADAFSLAGGTGDQRIPV